jgi:hypothetical protein
MGFGFFIQINKSCYEIDIHRKRGYKHFKIEKTYGRELLTAGLGLRYKKDTRFKQSAELQIKKKPAIANY